MWCIETSFQHLPCEFLNKTASLLKTTTLIKCVLHWQTPLTFLLENIKIFLKYLTALLLFNNRTKQSIHKTLLITKTVYETEIEQWLVHGIFRGQINDVLFLGDISFAQFMSSFGLSAGQWRAFIALETCLSTSFHLMLYCSPAACKKWRTPPALFAFPLIVCTSTACAESLLLPQFQRHIKKSEGQKTPKVELQISIYGVKILDPKTKVGFLKYKNILCTVTGSALEIKINYIVDVISCMAALI